MPTVILDHSFYSRCPKIVAQELLGKLIVSTIDRQRTIGIVVETEAYLSSGDTACHGFRGCTPGNRSMFAEGGRAYVYPIHAKYCFNVVTESAGSASAVLIRALEPVEGLRIMQLRRGRQEHVDLCSGPAKLCQSLGIDRAIDGHDLTRHRKIWLTDSDLQQRELKVIKTPRIGVTSAQNLKLRFVIAGNSFASGPKSLR